MQGKVYEIFSSISGSDNYEIYSCAMKEFRTCNLKDLYLPQVTGKAVDRWETSGGTQECLWAKEKSVFQQVTPEPSWVLREEDVCPSYSDCKRSGIIRM